MSRRLRSRRTGRWGPVAAAAAVLLLAAAPAAAVEPSAVEIIAVEAADFPTVSIEIALPPDLAGESLTAADFVVVEGGRRVSAAVWAAAEQPMEVMLLIDVSGSMAGEPLDAARFAALAFLERLPESAAVGVVAFGNEAVVAAGLEDDRATVAAAIGTLAAGGETALFDAVAAVPAELGLDPTVRRIVIVLSDGGDTVSESGPGQAAADLAATGAEVFAVALDSSESDRDALADLVAGSEGELITAGALEDLAAAYSGIADQILGRYVLTYRSRAAGPVWVSVSATAGESGATGSVWFEPPEVVTSGGGETPDPVPETESGGIEIGPAGGPEVVAAPGLLGGAWSLWAGAGGVLLAVVVIVGLLIRPGREGRVPAAEVAPAVSRGARGMLSFLSRGAEAAASGVLHMRKESRLDARLDRAGLAVRPAEYVVIAAAVAICGLAAGLTLGGPAGAIVLGVPALLGPRIYLQMATNRRRAAFSDQLEGTLQMIASSLRAGYGLMQAITAAAGESPSPTAEELDRVVVEERLGRPLVEALKAMAARMDDDDLRWVVEAIEIQQDVGGNLAEVLDTVTATIRDRNQIRKQVKALSAEGRMSAIILIGLPFGLAGVISMTSPDYIGELTSSMLGRVMLGAGFVLMAAGAAWIRRIIKVVF
jgi:tight adherence protein B